MYGLPIGVLGLAILCQVLADPVQPNLLKAALKLRRDAIPNSILDEGEEGEVRVVAAAASVHVDNSVEGRLEVYHDGIWGSVCDDSLDHLEAMVVCQQFGYAKGEVLGANFEPGEGPIWMDEVHCSQSTTRLADCRFAGWGNTDCSHREDVAVRCSEQITAELDTAEGAVRLVGGYEHEDFVYGRLEIYHLGLWGSVCNDMFDDHAALVVCRQLGYTHGSPNYYGPGGGKIWLDDVICDVNSRSLLECEHSGWGVHDCDHSEDVGIMCEFRNPN